jgi:UrcA family protein
MNTETQLARRSNNPIASTRTAALIALFALASAGALADQQPVLSLADLDLSTSAGVDAARDRLTAVFPSCRRPGSLTSAKFHCMHG